MKLKRTDLNWAETWAASAALLPGDLLKTVVVLHTPRRHSFQESHRRACASARLRVAAGALPSLSGLI